MSQHLLSRYRATKAQAIPCADPEVGGRGLGPPLKSQIYRVLSNTDPDSLKNHKSLKPALNVEQSIAKWRFTGGPTMARFY